MNIGRRGARGPSGSAGAALAAGSRQEGPVTGLVPVVDLRSGIVTDSAPSALTLDVPEWLGSGACEVYLDGHGLVHFRGADGRAAMQRTRPMPLSRRSPHERCFILDPGGRDEHGWHVYRLCLIEPGERARPPAAELRATDGEPG